MECIKCGSQIKFIVYLLGVGYCPNCNLFQKLEIITEQKAKELFSPKFIDDLKANSYRGDIK